jgi:hypothetical protein
MDDDIPADRSQDGEAENREEWRVDAGATRERLRDIVAGKVQAHGDGGKLIYIDGLGQQRRLPEDLSELSTDELAAAARATTHELGAVEPDYARLAAVERLNELRARGMVSEENYLREKRRLLGR